MLLHIDSEFPMSLALKIARYLQGKYQNISRAVGNIKCENLHTMVFHASDEVGCSPRKLKPAGIC